MDDDEIIIGDEPEPTKDEIIAKSEAVMAELKQLQAEYKELVESQGKPADDRPGEA